MADLLHKMNAESLTQVLDEPPRVKPREPMPSLGVQGAHELVRGVLAGDEEAAVRFFDEFAPLVQRTIARIVGLDEELSDVVQDTFLNALRTLHRLEDPQALPQWIRRVAVHTAIDWTRRRKRRRWLSLVDPDELTNRSNPSLNPTAQDAVVATYSILERLSMEERSVFALRYIEGLELNEVADACGFSLATAKRRLSAANRRFRTLAKRNSTLAHLLEDQERDSQ